MLKIDKEFKNSIYIPLFFILTIIAVGTSLQTFFFIFKGTPSIINLVKFISSKLIFTWYFILLAFILHKSLHVEYFKNAGKFKWVLLHIVGLMISLIVHHLFSREIDALLFGREKYPSLYNIVFNNFLIWFDVFGYILLLLVFNRIEYLKTIREKEKQYAELELKLMNSKLNELLNRVHPQFLFKTLQSISEMLKQNRNSEADSILSMLSDFLRTTVYEAKNDFVKLSDELKFLNQYLSIESIRFENKLIHKQNINANAEGLIIPGFIIQPIAEDLIINAFLKGAEQYSLNLNIWQESENFYISFMDNFFDSNWLEETKKNEVYSITIERLKRIFNNENDLLICSQKETGRNVKIKLPAYLNSLCCAVERNIPLNPPSKGEFKRLLQRIIPPLKGD